jgi:hypothetical protein
MLTVKVTRTVRKPNYQTFTGEVVVNGHDKLTPAAAIAATRIMFGNRGGFVSDGSGIGYHVYANSCRKVYMS